ncbi:MAG: SIMPL domain-containing protein [Brooklawnia sp.]|jgi:uncharacterized protein YggE
MTQPIVSVRGQATIVVAPETAAIVVHALVRRPKRADVEADLVRIDSAIQAVLTRMRSALRRSSASAISIHPVLKDRRSTAIQTYQGRRSWHLDVHDFSALPELLSLLLIGDEIEIAGPYWGLEPDSVAYQQAREQALRDALLRARSYAAAFGARIDGLLQLADQGMSGGLDPIPRESIALAAAPMARGAASAGVEAISLEPTEQAVYGSVEARFSMTTPDLDAPLRD